MAFNPVQLSVLSTLVDTMQSLPVEERATWLAGLTPDQAAFRPVLARLLVEEAQVETLDFLSTLPKLGEWLQANASDLSTGVDIGPYTLIRELGHGGMGTVWLAERSDGILKRTVALKLPHSALPQRQLAERFARERDILAALTHPNIARLYDAGLTATGQPYLALEYVEGEPLLVWCDRRQLGLRERIALYLQVLAAVQYAHGQLVVHRDLKPSNILVTQEGDVRLLDFGIAKLLIDGQVNETELTQLGGRALTLQYASPEQITGQAIGTASDVYTLGVVLYELLSGKNPYRLLRESRGALEEAILNMEPVRLSQTEISEAIAAARGTTPKKLTGQLAGDLDTILLKALKKDPLERFGTVDALAQDLGRYLRGHTVLARPDSTWYRARKFIGRNSLAVAAGALVTMVVLAASAVSIWQAMLAREQTKIAQTEAIKAKAVQTFLLDIFTANSSTQADPLKAQKTTARELLDLGAARIDGALKDAPQSRFEVLDTLATMYVYLGLYDPAAELRQREVDLAREAFGERDPRLAGALLALVDTLHEGQRRGQVPALLEQAFAVLDAAGDTRSQTRADALTQAARYWGYESLTEARRSADAAAAFIQAHQPGNVDLVTAYLMAGRARSTALDFAAAEPWYLRAIEAAQRQGEAAPVWLVFPTLSLGEAQASQLKYATAEAHLRAALAYTEHVDGEGHPYVLDARIRLSNLLLTVGRTAEGQALAEPAQTALAVPDARFGPSFLVDVARRLAATHLERGRPDLMVAPLRAEIADLRRTTPNFAALASSVRQLAEALAALGQIEEAQTLIDDALTNWQRVQSGDEGRLGATALGVSRAVVALARAQPGAALAALDSALPATPDDRIRRDSLRSRALLMLGRPADALAAADAALQAVMSLPEGGRPVARQAEALLVRGRALLASHDAIGATASLRQALALRRANDLPGSIWHEQAALALADARATQGRVALAVGLRAEAKKVNRTRSSQKSNSKLTPEPAAPAT
jgi:serine/threonine-protein kinase